MLHSAITSFESFEGFRPRWPATLLSVLGFVVLLEATVRLIPEERIVPEKSRQGEIFFMERKILPQFAAPKIVLLGSSRIRRAVVPKLLDRELGLKEGSTLNLGLASGRIFEALYLYQRNEEKLKSAELVVLGLDEWHLSSGWRLGSLYETHAPFAERVQFPGELRTRLLWDGLFTMRLKLQLLPNLISHRSTDRLLFQLDEENQVLAPERRAMEQDTAPGAFITKVETFYDHFNIDPVMLGHVEKLAALVKRNGGQFILLQLPNRAAYQAEVERLYPVEYLLERCALAALALRLNVPLYAYRLPEECGLNEGSYEDYGHITRPSAETLTKFLAGLIRLRMGTADERR